MRTALRTEIVDLLVNYMENRSSPEELEQVKQILSEGGYEAEWSAALLRVETAGDSLRQEIPAARRAALYRRIDDTLDSQKNKIAMPARYKWYRVAAAASIILFAVGLWLFYQGKDTAPVQLSAAVTAAKQQKELVLADGTKIWLNSSSKLSYPPSFAGNSRDVYLEGEAFFDVFPNPQQPFRIHLSDLTVQVYGTSFNIRSYNNDPEIAVAVATGKVGVTSPGRQKGPGEVLLPGNLLTYDRQQGIYKKKNMAIADINAWNDGWMIFEEETLENVCRTLERRYGTTIHFEGNSLRGKRITLKQQHESLQNVLAVIALTSGIRYRQQGNEIWLR